MGEYHSQLYVIVGEIQRANQESKRKSYLVGKAWENKRNLAINGNLKMTAKSPVWLKLSEDKKTFERIPKICKAIETIFKLKVSGKGTTSISSAMNLMPDIWKPRERKNEKGEVTFFGGWKNTTINKYLSDKTLLGEYQPHKMIEGKRTPIGESILDYYPAVIDKDLFYQVQNILESNHAKNGNGGGKTGKATNLFAQVVKCGLCGSPMHYIDKGKGSKGGTYLHCSKSRVNIDGQKLCSAKAVKYEEFKDLFFMYFDDLDIYKIIPNKNETDLRISAIEKSFISNKGQINDLNRKIEIVFDQMESSKTVSEGNKEYYNNRLTLHRTNLEKLEKVNEELIKEKAQLTNQKQKLKESFNYTKTILSLLDFAKDEQELIDIRLMIRAEMGKLLEWIKIFPLRPDEEMLVDLKAEKHQVSTLIKDKKKKGEKIGLGLKIRSSFLQESISDLKPDENRPDFVKSKYMEKIVFKFNDIKGSHSISPILSYPENVDI
ncbi:MAG: recombinase zinc beta ribbon domain-containing protein [Prolixibacteraceae bacterium]